MLEHGAWNMEHGLKLTLILGVVKSILQEPQNTLKCLFSSFKFKFLLNSVKITLVLRCCVFFVLSLFS